MQACRNAVMLVDASGVLARFPRVELDGAPSHDRVIMSLEAWAMLPPGEQYTAVADQDGRFVEMTVPPGWTPPYSSAPAEAFLGVKFPALPMRVGLPLM